jgi:hypothetical protein
MLDYGQTQSRSEIENNVIAAINILLERDSFLLQNNVNERSISHKLAEYLQTRFESWNVDCEYNRSHNVRKELHVTDEARSLDDTEAKTVFPDIIIHIRNTSNNLLVIEIKKTTSSENAAFDKRKLAAFVRHPFSYKYGLFIRFTTGQRDVSTYELEWFENTVS